MIFVTVGTQKPFDRLIESVDSWAGKHADTRVFAQTGGGKYSPKNIDHASTLSPAQFMEHVDAASIVIAHAGMGTILTCRDKGKRLVILPRRESLGEHRNDHQWATAMHLPKLPGITVVLDENDLHAQLDLGLSLAEPPPGASVVPHDLIAAIASFINE